MQEIVRGEHPDERHLRLRYFEVHIEQHAALPTMASNSASVSRSGAARAQIGRARGGNARHAPAAPDDAVMCEDEHAVPRHPYVAFQHVRAHADGEQEGGEAILPRVGGRPAMAGEEHAFLPSGHGRER